MRPSRSAGTRHAGEEALKFKRLVWSIAGGIIGAMVGVYFRNKLLTVVLFPVGVAFCYLLSGYLLEIAARGMEVFYAPSGKSTPARHGWSREEALVLKQRPAEAAALYEAATFDDPGDPEPFLRLARLHRDHLASPAEAVRWYRVARETVRITPPQALAAAVELVELCRKQGRLDEAAPELRWVAANFPGTPSGNLAQQDLATMETTQ